MGSDGAGERTWAGTKEGGCRRNASVYLRYQLIGTEGAIIQRKANCLREGRHRFRLGMNIGGEVRKAQVSPSYEDNGIKYREYRALIL
jgi:hypothetical protein